MVMVNDIDRRDNMVIFADDTTIYSRDSTPDESLKNGRYLGSLAFEEVKTGDLNKTSFSLNINTTQM